MANTFSEIASQIIQATTSPGGHSLLPRFLIRPLAAAATTDASGKAGKGVSDALVREAIALFDASRKRGKTDERAASDWRIAPDVGQAVQVLPPPLDELQRRALGQLGRRVQSLTLNHPHLAPILQAAYREGYPYLVARLGQEFQRLSQRAGLPLEPKQAFAITDQVMEALRYAHYSGFIHGALSLDDILVNERGRVNVLGVGLEQVRRLLDAQAPERSSPLLAPEAAGEEPVGTAADVYAVGALLYVLLTGQAPAAGQTVRVSESAADVPPAIDEVLTRALAVAPADRYPDLNALSHALRMAMHAARRPRPAPAKEPATRKAAAVRDRSDRISGFPDPLPMPTLDSAAFTNALPMPTFESLPVVDMPTVPPIPSIDWNAMLQPLDVSRYTNVTVDLPVFGAETFVDPFQAAAQAAHEVERVAQERAAQIGAPRAERSRRPKPQRRSAGRDRSR